MSLAAEQANQGRATLEGQIEEPYKVISQTYNGLGINNHVARNNESTLVKLSNIITRVVGDK